MERGDYGMARVRLASYLNSKGYGADVLQRLGQISIEMHDVSEAGRYWIASTAQGERVEQAVETFIRQAGSNPDSVVPRLPRAVREAPTTALPAIAKERLRRHGLEEALSKWSPAARESGARELGRVAKTIVGLVALLLFGLAIAIACIGCWTVGRWVFE
jgi:hypothetical protein